MTEDFMNDEVKMIDNKESSNNLKNSKIYKIIKEVLAIVLWVLVLMKLFIFDFDIYIINKYFPTFKWAIEYRFIALGAAIFLFAIGNKIIRNIFIYI
jgi:hypothetical protein